MGLLSATRGVPTVTDRLSREDARILRLDRGAIRGHTCKVLVLERTGPRPLPDLGAIRAHVAARLDAEPRLRQRLAWVPLGVAEPVWVDDSEFAIERHVTGVPTTGAVNRSELEQIVGQLMAERLDRRRPLWHLDVIERVGEDAMALVWRLHHCMADGRTAMRLGTSVLWSDVPVDLALPPGTDVPAWIPRPCPPPLQRFAVGLADRARQRPARGSERSGGSAAPTPPNVPIARRSIGRELGRRAARTPLDTRVGTTRNIDFVTLPLGAAKRAGKSIIPSATVNDVVLALIAGGARLWLEHRSRPEEGIRVKVPVSLHQPGENPLIGNRDSYFFVDLPVGEPDVAERVRLISTETRERKLDHDADVLYRLGAHPFVTRWAMSPHVFTFNVSNVPGPAGEIYVLGARVRELYSLAEIAQHHALRVAVISASGQLFVGLCADRHAVPALGIFGDGIRRAADELLARA